MVLAVLVATVAAALPQHGVLVPGRSLAGVRLGDPPAQVERRLGRDHGVCDRCPTRTWYYTYKPFTQPGLAVVFRRDRVAAVFTLWQPKGWRSTSGQQLGDVAPRGLATVVCKGYSAHVVYRGRTVTAYYVVDEKLWGFGLSRPAEPVCR